MGEADYWGFAFPPKLAPLFSAAGFFDCRCSPAITKAKPPGSGANAWGFTPDAALGSGDARNIDGIRIQYGSKRRLSAGGLQCDVVEGASVSWNSD